VIADAAALATQRMGWASVRRTQEDLIGTLAFTWASAGGGMGSAVFGACHDLTLVFAYSVLQDTLEQLEYEGHFKSKTPGLRGRMHASRPVRGRISRWWTRGGNEGMPSRMTGPLCPLRNAFVTSMP
jgi:hypothetical protein